MELMLPDYECLVFPPSMRAAAALCLAMKITDNSPWVRKDKPIFLTSVYTQFTVLDPSLAFTIMLAYSSAT